MSDSQQGTNAFQALPGNIPLRDQVAETLTRMIVDGKWQVGDLLPSQTDLSRNFSVSVPVVREALQVIKARGLVDIIHGRGVQVLAPSISHASDTLKLFAERQLPTLNDLIQLRFLLEPAIAALAAENATEEQIQELEAIIAPTFRQEFVIDEWIEAELGFHVGLARATGNALLPMFIEVFAGLFEQFLRMALRRQRSNGPAEHQAILAAIRARDPEAACQAMLVQLEKNREDLYHLQEQGATSNMTGLAA